MRWVYLSPHFDDVVLSCGGLVWEQVQAGVPVEIWTICAGIPDPDVPLSPFALKLHDRWKTEQEAVFIRQQEDLAAGHRLGAVLRNWSLPDCIYRRLPDQSWLVNGEEDLWKPVHPQEMPIVEQLVEWMKNNLQPDDAVVSPLTLGNHVDHFLVRAAAERAGTSLWYYADYPYAVGSRADIAAKTGEGWTRVCQQVSRDALKAWQEAVACYVSQISTFWGGFEEMQAALETYWRSGGGCCIWRARY
jgi:LmbE family N-acetylglucosaminyl deacetylase